MFFSYKQRLFQPIDIAPLVVFRVLFGFLLAAEAFGAILTGWVDRVFIEPKFTFTVIGFEWLQPLPGYGMYIFYGVMGIMGLMVMLGLFYRFASIGYTLLWTITYLMQKSAYNNHYYLLILLCVFMSIVPAHRYFSLDAKRKPSIKQEVAPYWTSFIFIVQMAIVYTYAALAKVYPDWLHGVPVKMWFEHKTDYPIIGWIYDLPKIEYVVSYGAILFDGLIVPAMLWRKTRRLAFTLSIVFHLFNSITFGIGIFPYMSLALDLFFFDPEKVRRMFLPKKKPVIKNDVYFFLTRRHKVGIAIFAIYFFIQTILPLRHLFIEGDVLWTNEGHKYAWRMMLRSRTGYSRWTVATEDGKVHYINVRDYVSKKQYSTLMHTPDVMWQFAQRIKQEYNQKGHKLVIVNVKSKVRVNQDPWHVYIDPEANLADVEWKRFSHNNWIAKDHTTFEKR